MALPYHKKIPMPILENELAWAGRILWRKSVSGAEVKMTWIDYGKNPEIPVKMTGNIGTQNKAKIVPPDSF